ncbi:hypothetical protein BDN67DRAFT_1017256 [Paxillus ammoniavirescens]|nr:hypothetical protein BDN67DRAFT_1017256 [Paxillus ammoniavirescens]
MCSGPTRLMGQPDSGGGGIEGLGGSHTVKRHEYGRSGPGLTGLMGWPDGHGGGIEGLGGLDTLNIH